MSCNGICIKISSPGYSGKGRTYGGMQGADYAGPSYFRDPNALTALEFEKQRSPAYARDQEMGLAAALGYIPKVGYAGKQGEKQYAMPAQKSASPDEERSRLGANIAYLESLQNSSLGGKALDYSLMASAKSAWEQMRALMEGNVTVISSDQVQGMDEGMDHLRVYTTIVGVQPMSMQSGSMQSTQNVLGYQQAANVSQRAASVARRRSLLEDLIFKEKERAALLN